MTDREKVIKGLVIERECVSRDCDRDCARCDLAQDREWLLSVYDEALELLKPVPPDAREVWIGSSGAFHLEYICGACGCGIMRNDRWKTKYCPECGKAVKWDET